MTSPARKFSVETCGWDAEQLNAVKYPSPEGSAMVKLALTAVTSLGSPCWPATWIRTCWPAWRRVMVCPTRESANRNGVVDSKAVAVPRMAAFPTGASGGTSAAFGSTLNDQVALPEFDVTDTV